MVITTLEHAMSNSSAAPAKSTFDQNIENTIIFLKNWNIPDDIKNTCIRHLQSGEHNEQLSFSKYRSIFGYGQNDIFAKETREAWTFVWKEMIRQKNTTALSHWNGLTKHLDPDLVISKTALLFRLLNHEEKLWYMQQEKESYRKEGPGLRIQDYYHDDSIQEYWWLAELHDYLSQHHFDKTIITDYVDLSPPKKISYACKKEIIDSPHLDAWLTQTRVIELLLRNATNEEYIKEKLPLAKWIHTPHIYG